jgi:hypothetical protein
MTYEEANVVNQAEKKKDNDGDEGVDGTGKT